MTIIPVIDIKQGKVVHAVSGQRNQYQAIQSKLCDGCNPDKIVPALLNLYPFPVVYIADIDAITGHGNNNEIITSIYNDYPQLTLWLDSGVSKTDEIKNKDYARIIDVIGTESGINIEGLSDFKINYPQSVLSLDFSGNQLQGDTTILNASDIWQKNIIVMTLNRVGCNTGPDFELASQIKARAVDKNVYIAGGISNIGNIEALKQYNIDGALIATALHTGNITGDEIKNVMKTT